jgi:hypothetical protein
MRRRHRSTASIEEEEGQSIATTIEKEKLEEEDNNDEDEEEEERICKTTVTIEREGRLTAAATVETPPLRMEIHCEGQSVICCQSLSKCITVAVVGDESARHCC